MPLELKICRGMCGAVLVGLLAVSLAHAAEPAPLVVRSWKETEARIAAHKGKVVVVEIWTTTCQTCLKGFPGLVKMAKELRDDGVVAIAVNCDYDGIKTKPPEFYRSQVEKFLKETKPDFEQVLLSVPFVDFLREQKLASTPTVLVYGRDGKLAKRFDNEHANTEAEEFTHAQIAEFIATLP